MLELGPIINQCIISSMVKMRYMSYQGEVSLASLHTGYGLVEWGLLVMGDTQSTRQMPSHHTYASLWWWWC